MLRLSVDGLTRAESPFWLKLAGPALEQVTALWTDPGEGIRAHLKIKTPAGRIDAEAEVSILLEGDALRVRVENVREKQLFSVKVGGAIWKPIVRAMLIQARLQLPAGVVMVLLEDGSGALFTLKRGRFSQLLIGPDRFDFVAEKM